MSQNVRPLTYADLDDLMKACPAREAFGPESENPLLAVSADQMDDEQAIWLRSLPCPVIGTGRSPAAMRGCDVLLDDVAELELLAQNIRSAPLAAMVLVQHLRASESLPFQDALVAESLAYATVQLGPEFRTWQQQAGAQDTSDSASDVLEISIEGGAMHLTLADPDNHNAIGVTMRDALCEALDVALAQPDLAQVHLTGEGRVFSTGGAVSEFGQAPDPATAHWVRSLRLPATRLVQLHNRLSVHVNGAAIGAGVEIAAFGNRITADAGAWFQLPELKYGLIPGAGGTVSLPRKIGRHRTAYLALSMKRVNAQTALEWGLVDDILS